MSSSMEAALEWFSLNVKGKGLRCIGLRVSFAAAVYGVWRERNSRIFRNVFARSEQVSDRICTEIRDFLSSRRHLKPSLKNKALCSSWGLTERIFTSV